MVNHYAVVGITTLLFIFAPLINYGTIFGAAWMKARGIPADRPKPQNMGLTFALAFFFMLVTTYVQAYAFELLSVKSYSEAIFHTGILGFALTIFPMANHHNFAHGIEASLIISIIDGFYDCLCLFTAAGFLVYIA